MPLYLHGGLKRPKHFGRVSADRDKRKTYKADGIVLMTGTTYLYYFDQRLSKQNVVLGTVPGQKVHRSV